MPRGGISRQRLKTQFRAKQGSSRTPKSPPACGRDRVGSQHRCEIIPPKQNQERNIIKSKRIRRGGFFPLRSAKRNISHHVVIYRIRRIYHAEGISCALRAQGEGVKPPASERFYSFQAVGGGAARLKRMGISRGSVGFPKENGGGSRQDRVDFCRRQICLRSAT